MVQSSLYKNITYSFLSAVLLIACNSNFKKEDYSAYFGGEIINPTDSFVLLCKDDKAIDTLKLDKYNRFFNLFDSLAPGLYSFKHGPEYQYLYFDKNDSIMVRLNANEFDQSIMFCGRGDQKNNFMIDLFLKTESDNSKLFDAFDYDITGFNKTNDSLHQSTVNFYNSKKKEINWNPDFDEYVNASLTFNYYTKKELYPLIHQIRTGEDVFEKLPSDFYNYRKTIDYNNVNLTYYYPFVNYLSHMLNNMGAIRYHNHFSEKDLSLKTNLNKLKIADSLITNKNIKNTIFNTIAFTYLLEDQNMTNTKTFLETYQKLSTDKDQKKEIMNIGNAINRLKVGNKLPELTFIDSNKKIINSSNFKAKTVIFFWTSKAFSHFEAVHRKIDLFKKNHPDYQFIGINLDSPTEWNKILKEYPKKNTTELYPVNMEELKSKWVITKIYRTILLDKEGTIKNAFANIFELNFEDALK